MIEDIIIFIAAVIISMIFLIMLPTLMLAFQEARRTPVIGVLAPKSPSLVTVEIVLKPKYFPVLADHALLTLLRTNTTGRSMQDILMWAVYFDTLDLNCSTRAGFMHLCWPSDAVPHTELDGVNSEEIDVIGLVDGIMKFVLPELDYYLAVGDLDFGRVGIEPQWVAETQLSLPDLSKKRVTLYLG
jgi:hypothetical protein